MRALFLLALMLAVGCAPSSATSCTSEPCICASHESCDFTEVCAGQRFCAFDCFDNASCSGTCGDRCHALCGASCAFTSGAFSVVSCTYSTSCVMIVGPHSQVGCEEASCRFSVGAETFVACGRNARCEVACAGPCQVSCAGATACNVSCSGGAVPSSSGDNITCG